MSMLHQVGIRTLLLLLVTFNLAAQSSLQLQLPSAPAPINMHYYVTVVVDARNDINNNGYSLQKGMRIPVQFNGGTAKQVESYFHSLISPGEHKLPVVVRIRKLHLTERNAGSTRLARTEMTLEFLRSDNDELTQLLELNTWMEQGGGDTKQLQEKNITDIIKKMALQFEDLIKENSSDPLFASSIEFRVRSGNPSPETDTLYWTEERRLTWNDFKGSGDGNFAAQSNCAFAQDIHPVIENNEGLIYITVRAAFLKRGSWVKKGQATAGILHHEQLHFDIAEWQARLLRKKIGEANLNLKNYESRITSLYNEAWDEYNKMQSDYDKETRHGTVDSEQQRWNKQVANGLQMLQQYR